jgi:DNA-binding protein YbaB
MGLVDKAKQVGQLNDMRKQAQQIQKALESEMLEHSYAGGNVKVTVRGDQKIEAITMNPIWFADQTSEKVASALKDAVNQAMFEIQKVAVKKLQGMGGGLGIPGL